MTHLSAPLNVLPRALKKRSSWPKIVDGLTMMLSGNSERKAHSPSARERESLEADVSEESAVETCISLAPVVSLQALAILKGPCT
jgi:hypothetical protein